MLTDLCLVEEDLICSNAVQCLCKECHIWFTGHGLVQVVHRWEENQGPITALAATPEDCILAGCHNGCMLVLAPRTTAIPNKFNLGEAP